MGGFHLGNRIVGLLFAGAIALCFLAFGLALIFYIGPRQAGQARDIARLPEADARALETAAPGSRLAVSGVLDGNETFTYNGLVAYSRERWVVERDSDGEYDGSWETLETFVPGLTVQLTDGGPLRTAPSNAAIMGGQRTSQIVEYGTGYLEEDGIPAGSIREIGFRNGDFVTVIGTKDPAGRLAVERLYGGERSQLVKEIQTGAKMATVCGGGLLCAVPVVLIIALVATLRIRFHR